MEETKLIEALRELEKLAIKRADGHLTIFRFTTGWKIMLHTPDLTTESACFDWLMSGRDQVADLPNFKSLQDAIDYAVVVYNPKLTKDGY